MKCVLKHQDLQMFGVKLVNKNMFYAKLNKKIMSNFHPPDENLSFILWRFKG